MPENEPINRSPWFAFRIWSEKERIIDIKMNYRYITPHRYHPKISVNGIDWKLIDFEDFSFDLKTGRAGFRLHLPAGELWVAAQEIVDSKKVYKWIDSLDKFHYIKKIKFGLSHHKRPLIALNIGAENAKNLVVVLNRQHPPEITGHLAMESLVETIAGNTDLANKFRQKFTTIVVPMLNPDGVDLGHWRHNALGADLNRDWQFFRQPETLAFKKFFSKLVKQNQATLYFALDFHSTKEDVFYVFKPEFVAKNSPHLTQKWIKAIGSAIPNYRIRQEAFGSDSPISRNWFFREFDADAVTYEVGDDTDRKIVKMKGRVAAEEMMKLLLKQKKL
jgi:predicted deacylase